MTVNWVGKLMKQLCSVFRTKQQEQIYLSHQKRSRLGSVSQVSESPRKSDLLRFSYHFRGIKAVAALLI